MHNLDTDARMLLVAERQESLKRAYAAVPRARGRVEHVGGGRVVNPLSALLRRRRAHAPAVAS